MNYDNYRFDNLLIGHLIKFWLLVLKNLLENILMEN